MTRDSVFRRGAASGPTVHPCLPMMLTVNSIKPLAPASRQRPCAAARLSCARTGQNGDKRAGRPRTWREGALGRWARGGQAGARGFGARGSSRRCVEAQLGDAPPAMGARSSDMARSSQHMRTAVDRVWWSRSRGGGYVAGGGRAGTENWLAAPAVLSSGRCQPLRPLIQPMPPNNHPTAQHPRRAPRSPQPRLSQAERRASR